MRFRSFYFVHLELYRHTRTLRLLSCMANGVWMGVYRGWDGPWKEHSLGGLR
jgi:hypothetical protein